MGNHPQNLSSPLAAGPTRKNFHDPIGLVFRMATSGNRAAWSALLREAGQLVLAPLDSALHLLSEKHLRANAPADHPMIFVVGAPRSGTTVVNQVLCQALDVTYFNNLSALFPRSPLTTARVSGRLRPPSTSKSYYGQTCGLGGPNDAFHIWNRWLGGDRYSLAELNDSQIREMRSFFAEWIGRFEKPLLNKNNRNTLLLNLLYKVFENSYFVIVRRDPRSVVASLIHARRTIQGNVKLGWGLNSRNSLPDNGPLGYVDDVCEQVLSIERELQAQQSQLPAQRIIDVMYESFCRDPNVVVAELLQQVPRLRARNGVRARLAATIKATTGNSLPADVTSRIERNLSG